MIRGGNSADFLEGGADDDTLFGGNGNDVLSGGTGNNTLIGGNGDDAFVISSVDGDAGFANIMDFDVGRQIRKMTYEDRILFEEVEGKDIRFRQAGDDVEIYFGLERVALIKGSEGALLAEDVLATV